MYLTNFDHQLLLIALLSLVLDDISFDGDGTEVDGTSSLPEKVTNIDIRVLERVK